MHAIYIYASYIGILWDGQGEHSEFSHYVHDEVSIIYQLQAPTVLQEIKKAACSLPTIFEFINKNINGQRKKISTLTF